MRPQDTVSPDELRAFQQQARDVLARYPINKALMAYAMGLRPDVFSRYLNGVRTRPRRDRYEGMMAGLELMAKTLPELAVAKPQG